jgi:hypothetical protein
MSKFVQTPTGWSAIPFKERDGSAIVSGISFARAIASGVDPQWGDIIGGIGSGMAVSQTGGNLVVTTGTTARSESIIRGKDGFIGGVRARARVTLSQRIVNQQFFVELVDLIGDGLPYTITSATTIDVGMPVGHPFDATSVGQSVHVGAFSGTGTFLSGRYAIAAVVGNVVTFTVSGFAAGAGTCSVFGWNYYQMIYDGATATSATFNTQRRGYADTAATATINTTASPGHIAVFTGNDLAAALFDQLAAPGATVAPATLRATRYENVPDDFELVLQVRVLNGSTAPASTTTLTVGYLGVTNYAPADVSIQDIRPMTPQRPLPVDNATPLVAGTSAIGDVGVQYRATATGAGTPTVINSPATPAVQTIKATAGRLIGFTLVNTNAAARFLKVWNAAAPTLGTTAAAIDVCLPPNVPVTVTYEGGLAFGTAITCAVTGARGATDNTAITGNEVTGFTVHA